MALRLSSAATRAPQRLPQPQVLSSRVRVNQAQQPYPVASSSRLYSTRPPPPATPPSNSAQQKPTWRPTVASDLPPGFTFYPNHNDYPVVPVPDPDKMYTSQLAPPHLPRTTVFHYIFPPKRKGKHFRYYPATDPRCIAFVDGLSGRELYRDEIPVRAMWLHTGLKRLGLKQGDVACIFGSNSLEWVEANFGIQAARMITSPANYGYTTSELLHQLTDSGAKVIFVNPELIPTLEKALENAPSSYSVPKERIILLCEYDKKPEGTPYKCISEIYHKQGVPKQVTDQGEKDTAYLCYSSGTTGRPKGVETSHHNMTSQVQAVNMAYQPLDIHDRILGILPFGHIYGLTLLVHQPMTRGTPVVVLPKFDLETVLECIQKYRITWVLMVPPMLVMMKNSPLLSKYDLSSLRGILCGASHLSQELIEDFEAKLPQVKLHAGYGRKSETVASFRVTQGYGLTETSPVTHCMTAVEGSRHHGKIGRILPTLQARVVNPETGDDVPVGERGELWLRGPSVMKGYWKNPEATINTFAPGGWFKTGDVVTVDEEGYFSVVDRVKELIKYKGHQVPPAELEVLLRQHPKVSDAGVIGVYSESQATEIPRAYVVPKGGLAAVDPAEHEAFKEEIAEWVKSKVSNHKRLRGGVVLVDVIPKSPIGKILRKVLREQAKEELAQAGAKL